ncbi:MAG: hypothetical protein O7C67_02595 [Gammaproteobacteria bacterium]|nr:hypothetical protein [Gammaproteobacteria bacterium]
MPRSYNIAKLLQIVDDETKIIPGHGPLARKADLQWFHDIVAQTIEHIEGEKRAGKTLEEIQSAGLPEKFASWFENRSIRSESQPVFSPSQRGAASRVSGSRP